MSGNSTQSTKATKEVDTDFGSDSDHSAGSIYEELSIPEHSEALSKLYQQKGDLAQEIQQAYLSLDNDEVVCQRLAELDIKQARVPQAIKKHECGLETCLDRLKRPNAPRMKLEKPNGSQAPACAKGLACEVGAHNQDEK